MFHRIVVDIVQMVLQVSLISNDVVPKTPLPEFQVACNADGLLVGLGKVGLERMHDLAKVAAPGRLEQQVQVIWQKDIGHHRERMQVLDNMQR